MADDYVKYTFGDTEFLVPSRYIELSARGTGKQIKNTISSNLTQIKI